MSIFRSANILHKHIRLPGSIANAARVLDKLGSIESDCIEFIDLTKDDFNVSKAFTPMIERCDKSLQKILYFEQLAQTYNIPLPVFSSYSDYTILLNKDKEEKIDSQSDYFDQIEYEISQQEVQIKNYHENLKNSHSNLDREILKKYAYEKYTILNKGYDILQSSSFYTMIGILIYN